MRQRTCTGLAPLNGFLCITDGLIAAQNGVAERRWCIAAAAGVCPTGQSRDNVWGGARREDAGVAKNMLAVAISTAGRVEILRLLVPVPVTSQPCEWQSWGLSLGYALINGMQHFFMLGAGELDFELEGPWQTGNAAGRYSMLSLAFIDPSLGGSGYLPRIAEQFQRWPPEPSST